MSKPVHVTTTDQQSHGPNSKVRLGEVAIAVVQVTPTVNTVMNVESSNTSSNSP